MRTLIVEDDITNQMVLETYLARFGECHIAANGEAGGTLSTSGVKIIMVTALDDIKNVFSSFKALCDVYLFKPIDTQQLCAHLQALDLIPK